MASFLPPVTFVVDVVAGQAIAGFEAINAELTKVQANSIKAAGSLEAVGKSGMYAKMALVGAGLAFAAFGAYATKASMENEVAANKLNQTLTNMGDSSAKTRTQINELANSMTALGFSDNVVMDSMSTLITATGSVADATHLNAVAMDMARFKHIPLTEASAALAKGTQGNAKAFKEFGIALDNSLPKQEAINKALTQLQQKMGGQAQAYASSLAGKIEILHAKFELMAENIGNVIIPIISKFVDGIFLIGRVIGAVVGPVISLITHFKTQFTVLAVVVGTAIGVFKLYQFTLVATTAVTKAYAAWQLAAAEGTTFFQTAVARLQLTMSFNPIGVWIAAITALVAGFVLAWNHSETFRKIVVEGMKGAVMGVGYLIKAFGWLVETFVKIESGPLRLLLKGLAALGFGPAKDALKELNKGIEGIGGFFDKAGNNVQDFADKLDGLKNKKIPLPKFGSGSSAPNTSRTDPFNLDNYSGAKGKDLLTPLYDDVKATYEKMTKVISDATDKQAQLVQDAVDREEAAQKNYDDAVFNLMRSHNDDKFKLDRDYADKKFKLQRSYQDAIDAAEKTRNDARVAAFQKAEDDKLSIVKKSIALLTNAFASATNLDIGALFSASFTKDNALANTLMNQVKNGVTTVVSWWGTAGKQGVDSLLKDLTAKLNSAKTLSDNAAKLAAQGYSQTFIQQIIAQGSEVGNQMADAILSASPEAQSQLKDLYSQIQDVSENGVTALATQMNSGAKLATKELTDAYAAVTTELNKTLANISTSFAETQNAANKTLSQGLADAEKDYNDAIFDMNTKLKNGLFDANKTLKEAIEASQKQFNTDVDKLQKDTIDKLKALQDELAATAAKIKELAGASAAVKVMANSPAVSYISPAYTGNSVTNQSPNNVGNGQYGMQINQTNNIVGQTTPAEITSATVGAIKYGVSTGLSYNPNWKGM
jgi:hypothetical protein